MKLQIPNAARRSALAILAIVIIAIPAAAHDAIRGVGGKAIRWSLQKVNFIINPLGSKDIADDSDLLAVRLAFKEWNAALGGSLELTETAGPNPTSKNVNDLSTHRVVFDSNDQTGYFPVETGIVAITPIHFSAANVIVDADIIFNERDHTFSTNLKSFTFDVRDVATHEIGHFIGLDHSPLPAASLYPYVDYQQTAHRSLSEDDILGARALYDSANTQFGSISGFVFHPGTGGTPVKGANVVARRLDGRTAAGTLTRANGSFQIGCLAPDSYILQIVPLDGPAGDDSLVSNVKADFDFTSTIIGGAATPTVWPVNGGAETIAGSLTVDSFGGPAILSMGADIPVNVNIGVGSQLYVWGSGFNPGGQWFSSHPDMQYSQGSVQANGNYVQGIVNAAPSTKTGVYDIIVKTGAGSAAVEAGALDVHPLPPSILQISPATGSLSGGEIITITGNGFIPPSPAGPSDIIANPGSIVIVGDRLAEAIVESPTKIKFTVPAGGAPGQADVRVVNPDGQEFNKLKSFAWVAQPIVEFIFPSCVSKAGGALVRVSGHDFFAGTTVTFVKSAGTSDSRVQAPATTVEITPTQMDILTPALVEGNYDIWVELPGGGSSVFQNAVTIVTNPDPFIGNITPDAAPLAGGSIITILGEGFVPGSSVRFNANLTNGSGGSISPNVTFISGGELQVTVPAGFALGAAPILVTLPNGQAASSLLFTYGAPSSGVGAQGNHGGGGGGGGCAGAFAIPGGGGPAPPTFAIILGNAPFLLVLAWALRRRRMIPAATAAGAMVQLRDARRNNHRFNI